MKRMTLALVALTLSLVGSVAAKAGQCDVSSPMNATAVVTAVTTPNYSLQGTATCPDFDVSGAMDRTLATAAALSMPAYLNPTEKFSVSGGIGLAHGGETAFGITAMARINKNVAAFAGGAVSTQDSDVLAGKAGLRVGW